MVCSSHNLEAILHRPYKKYRIAFATSIRLLSKFTNDFFEIVFCSGQCTLFPLTLLQRTLYPFPLSLSIHRSLLFSLLVYSLGTKGKDRHSPGCNRIHSHLCCVMYVYWSKCVQLMAQFRIFPSSESRHSFVANYTSAVKSKIHSFVLLYNYPSVCE